MTPSDPLNKIAEMYNNPSEALELLTEAKLKGNELLGLSKISSFLSTEEILFKKRVAKGSPRNVRFLRIALEDGNRPKGPRAQLLA